MTVENTWQRQFLKVSQTKPPATTLAQAVSKKRVQRAAAVFLHGSGACVDTPVGA